MARDKEDYAALKNIAITDVSILEMKGKGYGRSWIKRGGVGAFMMLARKWDRIENDAIKHGYDIIQAVELSTSDLLDDIQDLRRYLLLVEGELTARRIELDDSRRLDKVGAPGAVVLGATGAPRIDPMVLETPGKSDGPKAQMPKAIAGAPGARDAGDAAYDTKPPRAG